MIASAIHKVEINDEDASQLVTQHFNLPNHSESILSNEMGEEGKLFLTSFDKRIIQCPRSVS